jgi:outer membrane protein assembly factor BamB
MAGRRNPFTRSHDEVSARCVRRRLSILPLALLMGALCACGGGGGGSGSGTGPGPTGNGSPPPVSISSTTQGASGAGATLVVTPTAVNVVASNVGSAPSASIQISIVAQSGTYWITGSYTQNGIASTTLSASGSAVSINLTFKSPGALGVGVYKDTVTVYGCGDSACAGQITGSPQQIPITYTVTLPGPTITSAQPDEAFTGQAGFTLTVTGSGFTPESVIEFNGSPRTTTYVSASTLTTDLTAADLAQPTTIQITVSNQAANTPDSNFINYGVVAQWLGTISPNTASADAPGFTLDIKGEFFTPNSVVYWNTTALPTTYVSANELTATVSAADLTSPGSIPVRVAASQGTDVGSGTAVFTVEPLQPLALDSVSPASVQAGGGAFSLTVLGNGFTGSSVVQWNGAARTTRYVSAGELVAQIGAADIAATGSASVEVQDPSGTSSAATVTIIPASKDAVAFQITPAHSGAIVFNNVALPTGAAWSKDVGGAPSYAVIADGKVFVTVNTTQQSSSASSELLALDQATGATDWGPISIGGIANVAYDNGTLFVNSAQSAGAQLQAYDAATGTFKWALRIGGTSATAPSAENGMVYTTDVAVSESSGTITWQPLIGDDFASPTVTVDGVYGSGQCFAYDYRPATGEVVWSNLQGCSSAGGPTSVAANGVLYAAGSDTEFDAETGTVLGSFSADYPPAIGSQTGYFLSGGILSAIDLGTHTVLWTFTGDGQLATSPIIVDQYVFIGSSAGMLYALDGTTGHVLWQTSLGAAIPYGQGILSPGFLSGLSAGDGLLVVPAGTKVTAYTLSTNP